MSKITIKFWDDVKGLYIDDAYFLVDADMKVYFDTDYGIEPTTLIPHFFKDGECIERLVRKEQQEKEFIKILEGNVHCWALCVKCGGIANPFTSKWTDGTERICFDCHDKGSEHV